MTHWTALALTSKPSQLVVITFGLALFIFSSASPAHAVACEPPERGNYTLSSSCAFPNSSEGNAVDGVFQGDMVIPEGVTLTINAGQTVCFDPDSQVLLEGGNIAINETGQLKECYITEEMMGNLNLDTYGDDQPARIYENNLFVCTENPCSATAPSAAGNVILEGALKMVNGDPAAGRVLMSDADGVASWGVIGGGGWTDAGSVVQLETIGDTVGIGVTDTLGHKLMVNGSATLGNSVLGTAGLELNNNGTGNRFAFLDLHGDDTYTDYGARMIRHNTGANAIADILHRGTGALRLNAVDAGSINVWTNGTARMTVNSGGAVGINTTSPSRLLHVQGGAGKFRSSPASGTNQGGTLGQLTLTNNGDNGGVWVSFHREGVYATQFGLEVDNWFSTRGWSPGESGYAPIRAGSVWINHATQPWLFMADTNTNDWMILTISSGTDGLYFYTDTNGDGGVDVNTMIITQATTTLPSPMDLECSACIDQGDLKTTTGVYTSAVTAAGAFSGSEYTFFPNIEKDDCTPTGSQVLRPYPGNAGDSAAMIFWVDQGCSAGSWDIRFRYVTASRDPEIFGWYDPENDIIQALWVAELPLDNLNSLPVMIKNEEHPTWIPVQATLFDRDLARYGETIDPDKITQQYTFTRVAKADRLDHNDELVKTVRDLHDTCLTQAQTKSLDNPEGKCPQLITHPDIYYGKLERSDKVANNWQRHEAEKMAYAEKTRFTAGADLAENYTGQTDVMPGEIVAIDRAQNNFLVRATASESQQLAGVISTSPGDVLGEKQEGNIELALVGRVPVLMSNSSSPIQPGDMVTVSPTEPGKAAKATQAGWVVGKALEAWTPGSGKETVLILLNTSVYDPQLVQKSLEGYTLVRQVDGNFRITDAYSQIVDRVTALKELLVADVTAGIIKASQVEVAGVNIGAKLTQLDRRLETIQLAGVRTQRPTQAVGAATIARTETAVFVAEPRVTNQTVIFVTSRVASDQQLTVTEIQPGVGFTITIARAGQEIPFDYWLVK